jgi:ABC-2 type transport system permease protein/sodium transport system permease protein
MQGQLGRLGRLVRKELYEILRDRRTIITLVLMPLLLYPLLSIALPQLIVADAKPTGPPTYHLSFPSEAEFRQVLAYLGWRPGPGKTFRPTRPANEDRRKRPVLKVFELSKKEAARGKHGFDQVLWSGKIQLGVRVRNRIKFETGMEQVLDLELHYLHNSTPGREAVAWMERQCALANIEHLRQRQGVAVQASPLATRDPNEEQGNFLAALVPLILILMTITGAVYPAIDLTAGERERGTLEILVAAPVPRLGLLFAKYVTVLTVAVLTAVVNLVMMTGTLLVTGVGSKLFGGSLTAAAVLEVFALLLLFAAFFSAVLLALCSFARSFKEAQAYLIPVMLVALTPGMLAMKSDLKLTGLLPVAPLINIVLLARDLFENQAELATAAVVVLSTLLYALAALAIAARVFGAEGVLYNEQSSWSDLFRRPPEPRRVATLAGALVCVALLFPADFLFHGLLGFWRDAGPEVLLGLRVLMTVLLFGAFPLIAAAVGRVRPATAWQWHRAPWAAYVAAVLLGLSLWPFALEVIVALRGLGIGTLAPEQEQMVQQFLGQLKRLPPVVILFGYALVPAVFEELFFRGYLFSALRAHTSRATTILGSAALFGLFHLFFTFSQAVSATLLGVVLGWLCWQTRSVIPGIILHALHDGLIMMVSFYEPELTDLGWYDPGRTDVPPTWLAAGAVGVGLGVLLVYFGCRRKRRGNGVTG